MTSRSFLKGLNCAAADWPDDERVYVRDGDVVGVVLLGSGGPSQISEIETYLYRVLTDPLRVRISWLPRLMRARVARFLSRRRAPLLADALTAVGGAAPDLRLLREQTRALGAELNRYGADSGVSLRVYAAARYGEQGAGQIIAQMRQDDVTAVVLVPTTPVRLSGVSDSCVSWWQRAAAEAEFAHLPTAVVWEHAAPKAFVQAMSDRLDEALQRFPRTLRDEVQVVFALHPAAALDAPGGTPEQSPLAPLIDTLWHLRVEKRPRHLAYVQNWGLSRQPSPVLVEALETIASTGGTGVIVVPVGFTTDTMETAFELDVDLRARADALGLHQYEVAAALNCNALYLQALVESIGQHLHMDTSQGDGMLLPLPTPTTSVSARGSSR